MLNTPTYQDVLKATHRIAGHAIKTPLLTSNILDDLCGGRVFLKAENLQRTGSFKFRGAMNSVSAYLEQNPDLAKSGVIACSSGNHAQGIAEAARLLNIPATIIMPFDAPQIKVDRTRRSGATVLFFDRANEDRDVVTNAKAEELGAVLIHPYNNPYVMAGQGTCALEAIDFFDDNDIDLNRVFACTGGGGLSAGIATVLKERLPKVKFHTVEPEDFDDYSRSLVKGERVANPTTVGSICDAIITPTPGELSFSILKDYASQGLTISDEDALRAVAFAFNELKVVVEPGGAAALAALLSKKIDIRGETVLVTLSGGNIDPEMMQKALSLEASR
ncbi:MAG: threonine/serine dehydratase [Hyphomicrobiales bacterium]